jgi:hypothetical protein
MIDVSTTLHGETSQKTVIFNGPDDDQICSKHSGEMNEHEGITTFEIRRSNRRSIPIKHPVANISLFFFVLKTRHTSCKTVLRTMNVKNCIAILIPATILQVGAIYGVMQFYNILRAGISWKGPEAIEL